MLASTIPAKFPIPFAADAGGSYIRTIPEASQIGITNGAASLTDGFPPLNFQPLGAGGVPPAGQDMNGILLQITQWTQWQNAGGAVPYDGTFQSEISGYPKGAIIASAAIAGLMWQSTADNNTTNPDTGGAGWVPWLGSPTSHYGLDTGSANAYVVGLSPALVNAPSVSGMQATFIVVHANTGPSTINLGWGAVPLVQSSGSALTSGQLAASSQVTVTYDQPSNKCYLTAGATSTVTQVFSQAYTSTGQAISGAEVAVNHGLGTTPSLIMAYLLCGAANLGYSTGDLVQLAAVGYAGGGGGSPTGSSVWANATQVGFSWSTLTIANKTTGAVGPITNADWTIVLKAWV